VPVEGFFVLGGRAFPYPGGSSAEERGRNSGRTVTNRRGRERTYLEKKKKKLKVEILGGHLIYQRGGGGHDFCVEASTEGGLSLEDVPRPHNVETKKRGDVFPSSKNVAVGGKKGRCGSRTRKKKSERWAVDVEIVRGKKGNLVEKGAGDMGPLGQNHSVGKKRVLPRRGVQVGIQRSPGKKRHQKKKSQTTPRNISEGVRKKTPLCTLTHEKRRKGLETANWENLCWCKGRR